MKNSKATKSVWDSRSDVYFDLIMKKECPGGEHAHSGYTVCHPLDKPHKPGTSADEFHKANGVANSWFEKHGTSREQWEKENVGTRKPYTRKKEPQKEEPPIKEEQPPEIPPHIDYPEIKYGSRSSDISTKEAEWIFSQGGDEKAWKSKLSENKEAIKSARAKLDKLPEDATPKEIYKVLESTDGLSLTVEDSSGMVGGRIGFGNYKYADLNSLTPKIARQTVRAILVAKENMYLSHPIKVGAVTSSYVGVCWSNGDGSSTVRLEPRYMNENDKFNAEGDSCYYVKGEEATTTPIHEFTHSYINAIVHDFIAKGKENGMIDEESSIYEGMCVGITHGDIPKGWIGKPVFNSTNCKGKEYESIGRFTQTVVSEAKKVARSIYGMESDTFRSQMTSYGRTKDKEAIPEAVSDYLANGENATLANKLIYFSLQRYAKFVYSDDKEITPIGDYIKELRAKQKGSKPKKKTKSIRKEKKYISFAQLGLVRL